MNADDLTLGIIGCGQAARIHAARLTRLPGVRLIACADADRAAAEALAASVGGDPSVTESHEALLGLGPRAVAIFTPHRAHYRPALDALQAGCHVFVEKPLSTNPQEAMDLVKLARGRERVLAVGHQYRLRPSLIAARRRLAEGAVGRLRLVAATLATPWLATHSADPSWRSDPRHSGGGLLTDAGDHLLDALLWLTGRPAVEVAAFQDRVEPGLDVVDAIALRLADGAAATLALAGTTPAHRFELTFHGDAGILRVTDTQLEEAGPDGHGRLESPGEPAESIDGNFVAAIREGRAPCCPAEEALDTVRLQDAVARSAATGRIVRLA